MQTITTNAWTQITGLDNSKTYILQAQYEIGDTPIVVNWYQNTTPPTENLKTPKDDKIKAKGSTPIYVKTQAIPVNIVVQEVI